MKLFFKHFFRWLTSRPEPPLSPFQLIWTQSKINGGQYHGDNLPVFKWQWPRRVK